MKTFLALLAFVVGSLISVPMVQSQQLSVTSPNGVLRVTVDLTAGMPTYTVDRFGIPVVESSRLGFELQDLPDLVGPFRIAESAESTFDETWEQPWGEVQFIRDHHNELRILLEETSYDSRRLAIVFRVFDDGVGFRYEIPEQDGLEPFHIMDELTEIALTGDHRSWWIGAYQWNRYEYLYEETLLSEIDVVHTPVTFETADGLYISLHEAAVVDYPTTTLRRTGSNTFQTDLVPWSDGVRVRAQSPMVSPWRTIKFADNPGELITNYIELNLNDPNVLEDISWIEPGKYIGIWWTMHIGPGTWGSGPNHAATTENAKRHIDFAAEHGFLGVLVEGWNTGWDGDWLANGEIFSFTESHPDFDIEEVARYAAEKGVRLIGHHETGAAIINYEAQMEDAYALYERLGVREVKTGYVGHGQEIKRYDEDGNLHLEWHHGQHLVRHHQLAVETAARHRISLNVHEPVKDTGLRRTWPNLMTREGARGQEYEAWGENGGNPPDHTVTIPFTRMLAGPMDFTPGTFDLLFTYTNPDNRVNTTLAKQLALFVVLYSPMQMASDLPENYEARLDAFQFIKDVPADWADTQVLHARIGDYVTFVRKDRNSEDWYLGSITDEHGRILSTTLHFLDPGRTYRAEIYRDSDDADWLTNPYGFLIEHIEVDHTTRLDIRLAPGGGQAIRFTPTE